MPNTRLRRFEKLRRLKQNEYDRLVLLAGRIQLMIQQLETQQAKAREQQVATQHIPESSISLAMLTQCHESLKHWHDIINALEQRKNELQKQLTQVNQAVREQKGKLDAWDKLIDKERRKQVHAELIRDMASADEQYLMNQFSRSES